MYNDNRNEAQVSSVPQSTKKVNKMSEDKNLAIKAAFDTGIAAGKDHDDIIYDIKKAGGFPTFNGAERKFKELAIDAGIIQSRDAQVAKVKEILSEATGLDNEEGYTAAILAITSNVKGINERSAVAFIRWHCEENKINRFIKPREVDPTKTRFVTRFFNALEDRPDMTEEEAEAFIMGENGNIATSTATKKKIKFYQKVRALVNTVVGVSAEDVEDDENDEE